MTITSLIITDLTRMSNDRVCIAGVTSDYRTIRPEFNHSVITEEWLYDQAGNIVIKPFARVRLDLLKHSPEPPHTEDWLIRSDFKQSEGFLDVNDRKALLQKILDPNVAEIFGAEIHHDSGYYINENEGNRSLGTVKVASITKVMYRCYNGKWDYRIKFIDRAGGCYRLGVTDLAFQVYLDYLRETQGIDCDSIGYRLEKQLQNGDVFLRIGLARPTWSKRPHCCFLQINGVYSFPDYLGGKCFADFLPN